MRTIALPFEILVTIVLFISIPIGCNPESDSKVESKPANSVVAYVSVDEVFARTILDRFEEETGTHVAVTFDSEAGKTTGLVNKIIAEVQTGRPRADVFWSSEIFNTIRLADMGLLKPYDPPSAADIPDRYRDRQRRWTALAVRGRVVAFDPAVTPRSEVPSRWEDFASAGHAAHCTIANPLFGTTRGHVAAMLALWGPDRFRLFLEQLRDGGVQIADGNSAAVRAVMAKKVRFAFTDTDDVWVAQRAGASMDLVYPDMGDGGTLLIPCTVALIQGRPNHEAAQRLVNFLVSDRVEQWLAESDSRNIPVREAVRQRVNMSWPAESKLTFDSIAKAMEESDRMVREILLR